jgi:hypothetical protein
MLTIFSVPKPFEGHIGVIQRNAIQSWRRLRPTCQVILCGDEAGTADVAAEVGVEWLPDVERNAFGTPLLSSVFAAAEASAKFPLLCYVNADIVLLSDLTEAARRVAGARSRFLLVGQRWDLDLREPIPFERETWERELRERVARSGTLHAPSGSDYFLYPRGAIGALPAFAVGRPAWDNWVLYRARSLRMPVIDATAATLVIHQNHAYGHVKGATDNAWEGPEAERNRELMGGIERVFTLADATHRLTATSLGRFLDSAHLKRRARTEMILNPALRPLLAALDRLRGTARRRPS